MFPSPILRGFDSRASHALHDDVHMYLWNCHRKSIFHACETSIRGIRKTSHPLVLHGQSQSASARSGVLPWQERWLRLL